MKNISALLLIVLFIATSCSSGKKALEKGDYYSAMFKAVNRLESSPKNKNATKVLRDGYPMALNWSQNELDEILTGSNTFKWEEAINIMTQVNNLTNKINKTPAARKIIREPKKYTSELDMALDKASDERYNAGLYHLKAHTQNAARIAYNQFLKANQFSPGYKDVVNQLRISKKLATVTVILETIPLNAIKYKLSSEFFYDQIYGYLNNKFPKNSFVNFYSPYEAEKAKLKQPDFVVRIEFYDFSVGNTEHNEVEEIVKHKVEIPATDSTRAKQIRYEAKLKTYTDKVISEGTVNLKIIDFNKNKVMRDRRIPGSFVWINNYAIFVGDIEALSNKQAELTKRKALSLPPKQDLFIEFTKPIYSQLTQKLRSFFRRYD
jgi:hypothetical protein